MFKDDVCNDLIKAMLNADAVIIGTPVYFAGWGLLSLNLLCHVIIGTPVYFAGPNGALCALLDRVFYAVANYGQMLKGKPAAAIATCGRAGATPSIDRLNKYFTFSQMPIVSSDYWNGYLGEKDDFGTEVLKTLAQNMLEMIRK